MIGKGRLLCVRGSYATFFGDSSSFFKTARYISTTPYFHDARSLQYLSDYRVIRTWRSNGPLGECTFPRSLYARWHNISTRPPLLNTEYVINNKIVETLKHGRSHSCHSRRSSRRPNGMPSPSPGTVSVVEKSRSNLDTLGIMSLLFCNRTIRPGLAAFNTPLYIIYNRISFVVVNNRHRVLVLYRRGIFFSHKALQYLTLSS